MSNRWPIRIPGAVLEEVSDPITGRIVTCLEYNMLVVGRTGKAFKLAQGRPDDLGYHDAIYLQGSTRDSEGVFRWHSHSAFTVELPVLLDLAEELLRRYRPEVLAAGSEEQVT